MVLQLLLLMWKLLYLLLLILLLLKQLPIKADTTMPLTQQHQYQLMLIYKLFPLLLFFPVVVGTTAEMTLKA